MVLELIRLLLGLSIAVFHRPLANKAMQYERALDRSFRDRGVNLPAPLSDAAAENLYFAIGIFICLLEAGKFWMATSY
jgi:hypothetical protein